MIRTILYILILTGVSNTPPTIPEDTIKKVPTDIGHDIITGKWVVDTIHVVYPSLI